MAGTKKGAAKAKRTNLLKYGKDFFADIGSKGGSVRGVKKGFAANPELARLAGMKGGVKSKRGPETPEVRRRRKAREAKVKAYVEKLEAEGLI